MSNYLYLCTLPSNQKPTSKEPKEVLLRVYGEIFYEGDAPLLDTVVFSLLSERRHAPKLYGVFREGRLEQYIPVSFKIYPQISRNGSLLFFKVYNEQRVHYSMVDFQVGVCIRLGNLLGTNLYLIFKVFFEPNQTYSLEKLLLKDSLNLFVFVNKVWQNMLTLNFACYI